MNEQKIDLLRKDYQAMYEALKDLTNIMKMSCSMNYLYKHNLSLPLSKAENILAKAGIEDE